MNPNGNMAFGPFWNNGPSAGSFYNFPSNSVPKKTEAVSGFGTQHSAGPITTGTSIVGIKYNDGVVIAGDMLISYGNLARFHDVERVFQINEKTILGMSGDYADFQFLKQILDDKIFNDSSIDDKNIMKPKALYNYLTRYLYNKRSNFTPLWLDLVVGGMEDGEPFLGHVNVRGRSYTNDVVATGYGTHLALPLLREYSDKGSIDSAKADELIRNTMEVLFYRDCRGYPKYSQANITAAGCTISKHEVAQNWDLAHMIKGY